MRLIVCTKQVPDTSVPLRVRPGALEPEGGNFLPVMNPYDEFALEAVLHIRDSLGQAEIVLVTLAQEPVEEMLFHGLAMGADRAVVLQYPRGQQPDALATARFLSEHLRPLKADIILFGERAVDTDAAQTGVMVAEFLGFPVLCGAETLTIAPGPKAQARCRRGDRVEFPACGLPCVATFVRGPELPRYPSLDAIFEAGTKPVDTISVTWDAGSRVLLRRALTTPADNRTGQIFAGETVEECADKLMEALLRAVP